MVINRMGLSEILHKIGGEVADTLQPGRVLVRAVKERGPAFTVTLPDTVHTLRNLRLEERIADLTGADFIKGEVRPNAVSIYEWVLRNQAQGRRVFAGCIDDQCHVTSDLEALPTLILPDKMDEACEYFKEPEAGC